MAASGGEFIDVAGQRLELLRVPAARPGGPAIVMLHEGLGSVAMWRDFPARVAQASGCGVFAYSRLGYGRSTPLTAARPVRYMHDEALVTLPALLDALGLDSPVLLGHSDGASIALIHAGGSGRAVSGVVALAPHVLVEPLSVASIAKAREAYLAADLRQRLGRYHEHVDSTFWGWNDIWLHPDFLAWNIEEFLPRITCPVLAIQGEQDEYGTMDQIERIGRLAPEVERLKLAHCRHSPHRDRPEAVLEALRAFMRRLHCRPTRSEPRALTMKSFQCGSCFLPYHEHEGLPAAGIAAGTPWERVPESFVCPECGTPKSGFIAFEPGTAS